MREQMAKYKELLADNLTAPMKMELMVSNADGSNQKTLTNFGCASFAPTFTPDGKKILFASNKQECDSRKFELYLINVDGTGLEQVTKFRRIHFVPRVLAGRQDAGVLLRQGRQGALRVQYLHGQVEQLAGITCRLRGRRSDRPSAAVRISSCPASEV